MADFFPTYGFLIVSMVLGAMLGLSLYLPLMAGQLSLASPGFYALAGYIAAIMSTQVFNSSGGLFPIPLLLLDMLISWCSVWTVGHRGGNSGAAVAWDLLGDRYYRLC